MEGLNKITGDVFVSVDKAYHALDDMTLPEGLVTTLNGNEKGENSNESEVKAVNLQCSCEGVPNRRYIKMVILWHSSTIRE